MQERICLCFLLLRPFKVCVRKLHYCALMCYECEARKPLSANETSSDTAMTQLILSCLSVCRHGILTLIYTTSNYSYLSHCNTTRTAHARTKLFGEDTIAKKRIKI